MTPAPVSVRRESKMTPQPQSGNPPEPVRQRDSRDTKANFLRQMAKGEIPWLLIPAEDMTDVLGYVDRRSEQVRWHAAARDVGVRLKTYRQPQGDGLIIRIHPEFGRRKVVSQ